MKRLNYIILVLLFFGCRPCETEIIYNSPLPDSALELVPYKNGETYKFRHSNGLIISFATERETTEEQTFCDEYCCAYEYHFEINKTRLTPDYPIFDFYFEISNRDTAIIDCYFSAGMYGFAIPNTDFQSDYYEKLDSMVIDSMVYENVYKLSSNYGNLYKDDPIYAETVFYNYAYGILKIQMSNGESYAIAK